MAKKKVDPGFSVDPMIESIGNGKNVLFIMADEFRFPIHKDGGGMLKDYKNVLGFQNVDNEDEKDCISEKVKALFPGFMKLRNGATVLENHTVATTACVPSRAALFTGQYGSRNGVTQTDGVFKSADDPDFHWLRPEGLPTIGHWFKENQYSTHYFGKCHFAHPKKQSLKQWGFDDWESSFPEPHGTLKNNLGMYRDHGFTDLVTTFLRRKGMALDYDQQVGKIEMDTNLTEGEKELEIDGIQQKPWFAVASFTNPHDITTWPVLPSQAEGNPLDFESLLVNDLVANPSKAIKEAKEDLQETIDKIKNLEPLGIPHKGKRSAPPEQGTWTFNMNPGGIKQDNATLPTTSGEKLRDKPDCQFDYSLKLGIALAAKTGSQIIANNAPKLNGMPLALTEEPDLWTTAYIQYYTYLHHVLDQQINSVLNALDESGLRDDTIVVFMPDHGEYGGSHGKMMQKWHTAYQEAIHVPVVVSLPENLGKIPNPPKPITELTSHIDILPTLLGITGVKGKDVETLADKLSENHEMFPFVGADLSDLINGDSSKITDPQGLEPNGRNSILFTTSDMISEPVNIDDTQNGDFNIFKNSVDHYFNKAKEAIRLKVTEDEDSPLIKAVRMKPGSVRQPAEVHCIREDYWKLVRYRDYHNPNDESKFQWELYELNSDPIERYNLLTYKTRHKSQGIQFEANEEVINSKGCVYDAPYIEGESSSFIYKNAQNDRTDD